MAESKTALFVIDIQKEMAGNIGTDIPEAESLREASTTILKAGRGFIEEKLGKLLPSPMIIVFVQHEEEAGPGATLVKNTKPWELVFDPIQGNAYEWLIQKTTPDTFESNPDLPARLQAEHVTDIVTMGIQSDMCVRWTSRGALKAGFNVTLLSGAHGTYDEKNKSYQQIQHEIEKELTAEGVKVVPWKDYIDRLR